MKVVSNYKGNTVTVGCLSCAIEQGDIEDAGNIIKTTYFNAHQDFETPIEGFIIISSRRHITSVDEFTEEELQDFIHLLAKLRRIQRQILDIQNVYIIQKESSNRHLHFWMLPRYPWMDKKFGTKIESVTQIIEYAKANDKGFEKTKAVEEAVARLKKSLEF